MRLFVAGGAGFIGTNFIRWVLANQPDVSITNYDALTYAGDTASLADIEDDRRYRFVRGDICDAVQLADAVPGHDAIINFAAESHVDRSIEGAGEFVRSNVGGANALFEAALRNEIPRFLHISTDETYGSIPEPGSFREGDTLEPNSPYAASKAAADLLARAYSVTHGYPITITRTSNNFGPYQFPEKVIPLFVTNLLQGLAVPLYGDGRNVRDWTYVTDNVEAQWLVLTHGQPGTIYNVGAGNEMSNRTLALRILERFGYVGDAADEMIEHVVDRPGHDLRYSVDSTRCRELGWAPKFSFDEALDSTIDWYRSNESWWGPLRTAGAGARKGLTRARQ